MSRRNSLLTKIAIGYIILIIAIFFLAAIASMAAILIEALGIMYGSLVIVVLGLLFTALVYVSPKDIPPR